MTLMLVEERCFDNSEVHYVTPRKLRFVCLRVKRYWKPNLSVLGCNLGLEGASALGAAAGPLP